MANGRFTAIRVGIISVFWVLVVCDATLEGAAKSTGFPKYDRAVSRAVSYIKSHAAKIKEPETTLVAYALLKAGEPTSSGLIQHGVRDALDRVEKGYVGYDHIYLAGVDALLLSEVDADLYFQALQTIADHVTSKQHPSGGWSEGASNADTSMAQYGMLALWAANGAGALVSPEVVERNVNWHLANGTSDGSWWYRPENSNAAKQSHNLSMAGAGSLGIGRLLLHGPKTPKKSVKPQKKFGILEKVGADPAVGGAGGFSGNSSKIPAGTIDARIGRAFNWIEARFPPPKGGPSVLFPYYFFYALERAAALHELGKVNGKDWYEAYGDVLISMQNPEGAFDQGSNRQSSAMIGSSFAVLYLMRSTQQILDKQYGTGIQVGGRGLDNLFGNKEEKKKDIGPLDALLRQMESADLSKLDNLDANDVVEKITYGSKEELIGQVDLLKKLLKHPDATNRQAAYFGLGRTGDFSLIPEMLQGLRDPNVDVNVEALMALRHIARKPNGFGLSTLPLSGAETADNKRKVQVANAWRTKAHRTWASWYRRIRPYEEGGGIDELELLAAPGAR